MTVHSVGFTSGSLYGRRAAGSSQLAVSAEHRGKGRGGEHLCGKRLPCIAIGKWRGWGSSLNTVHSLKCTLNTTAVELMGGQVLLCVPLGSWKPFIKSKAGVKKVSSIILLTDTRIG